MDSHSQTLTDSLSHLCQIQTPSDYPQLQIEACLIGWHADDRQTKQTLFHLGGCSQLLSSSHSPRTSVLPLILSFTTSRMNFSEVVALMDRPQRIAARGEMANDVLSSTECCMGPGSCSMPSGTALQHLACLLYSLPALLNTWHGPSLVQQQGMLSDLGNN